MMTTYKKYIVAAAFCRALVVMTASGQSDPLPSWNEGKAKKSITDFVAKVTRAGSPDFVPIAERIATFDNDGTLWAEHRCIFQAFFIFDRIRAPVRRSILNRRKKNRLLPC